MCFQCNKVVNREQQESYKWKKIQSARRLQIRKVVMRGNKRNGYGEEIQ
jgi:hypothetical protein